MWARSALRRLAGCRLSSSSTTASTTQSYTDRMKAKGRPVSPHVTQYKFPIVAVSSITQRVTGVLLTVGLGSVAGICLVGGNVADIASALSSSAIAPAAKFAVAFPLTYHFCGAVRHAIWDEMPETLDNTQAERSSWAIIGVSTLASIGLASLSLSPKPTTPKADE